VHDLEIGGGRLLDALDLFQPLRRRRQHFGERAELGDQLLGERLDVALRDGAKQHQLEQLIVGDGIGAGIAEARTQPLAMAEVMRRALGEAVFRIAVPRPCGHDPPNAHGLRSQG
jgi:hypothetical protein